MTSPSRDLLTLLRNLEPELRPGVVAFCPVPRDVDPTTTPWIALIEEEEGLTAVVPEETAAARGWAVSFRARLITLRVYSDLESIGLTAAVAQALATAGISCNVIAAVRHDHIFVPVDRDDDAMAVLRALSASQHSMPSESLKPRA